MDTLPTVTECILCTESYAPTYGSQKQQTAINAFSHQIEELWHKAFSEENVGSRNFISRKVDAYMKEYRTKVRKNHRTSERKALKTGKVKTMFFLIY